MKTNVLIVLALALFGSALMGQGSVNVGGTPMAADQTGVLRGVTLHPYPDSPICADFSLTVTQMGPSRSVTFSNSCGSPNNVYVNLVSLVAVDFPNGPMFGIDLTLEQAINEITFGQPFFGSLKADGSATWDAPPPPPVGLTIYCVALELSHLDLTIVNVTPPFAYTVM